VYQEESLAYCSGQCQASRYPPASCRCPCQGRNHGVLRFRNPVINVTPYGFVNEATPLPVRPGYFLPRDRQVLGLPEIKPKVEKPIDSRPFSVKHRTLRKVGHSLKVSITGYSQDDLNRSILDGLRKQFSQERVDSIVTESFSEFFSHNPDLNTPELYELYENSDIDRVLDRRGIRWVIGRPKVKR